MFKGKPDSVNELTSEWKLEQARVSHFDACHPNSSHYDTQPLAL